jgi:hypothetical protein
MFLNAWIDDQMQSDDDQRRSAELRLLKERVALVKRPILWHQLVTRVTHHISTYRETFPDKRVNMRLMKPREEAFTLEKASFPCLKLHAEFLDGRMIELVFEHRQSDLAPTVTWAEFIEFTIDDQDNVQFLHQGNILVDTDDAARVLLTPILMPGFTPPESARPVPTRTLRQR